MVYDFFKALASCTSSKFYHCSTTVQGLDGTNNIISMEYIPFIYDSWRWNVKTVII